MVEGGERRGPPATAVRPTMPVTCPHLDATGHYERTATGWIDAREERLLRLTTRLADHQADVEVWLDVTPSPGFEVARAQATRRAPSSDAAAEDPLAKLPALAGLRLIPGFRRRVVELLGPHPQTPFLADAVLEAARLSRQATRIDAEVPARPTPRDFHRLDLQAWPEFADMCFTYSAASSPLFDRAEVRVPATRDMYAPAPGARFVFHRYKRSEVTATGEILRLYQSMFDQVHGFELWYDMDVRTQRVLRARSLTPRLPYVGICEGGQGKGQALVGVALDERWPTVLREVTGGTSGCFQLTDLTSDLFRLLTFA
jgi:DUF2889 family protein